MLVKQKSICIKYSLYNDNGDWQCIVQEVNRTLAGKCKKQHDGLLNDTGNWRRVGVNKHKAITQKLCQKVFKKKDTKIKKM